MNNNLDSLEFCYFPIKQKLWIIKVKPSFSSMISSVSRSRVAQFVVLCAAKYEKVIIPTWTNIKCKCKQRFALDSSGSLRRQIVRIKNYQYFVFTLISIAQSSCDSHSSWRSWNWSLSSWWALMRENIRWNVRSLHLTRIFAKISECLYLGGIRCGGRFSTRSNAPRQSENMWTEPLRVEFFMLTLSRMRWISCES